MERIASPKRTKEIVAKHGFYFSKGLGQNFLIDYNIIEKIVGGAGITSEDTVIEVGPGIGSLTQGLAEAASKVVAVEVDQKLIPILEENLREYSNVKVIHEDILKVDINNLLKQHASGKKVKVVGNLPYYITTPIIMRFLEEKIPVDSITIMIQKEVAERMAAKPSTKEYGTLSIAVQYYCDTERVAVVPPSVFIPQPSVDSSVIKLTLLERPRVEVQDEGLYFALVKDAFGKRRKTLLNALSTGHLNLNKELVRQVLAATGIDEKRRGETLSLEEFAALANQLSKTRL